MLYNRKRGNGYKPDNKPPQRPSEITELTDKTEATETKNNRKIIIMRKKINPQAPSIVTKTKNIIILAKLREKICNHLIKNSPTENITTSSLLSHNDFTEDKKQDRIHSNVSRVFVWLKNRGLLVQGPKIKSKHTYKMSEKFIFLIDEKIIKDYKDIIEKEKDFEKIIIETKTTSAVKNLTSEGKLGEGKLISAPRKEKSQSTIEEIALEAIINRLEASAKYEISFDIDSELIKKITVKFEFHKKSD